MPFIFKSLSHISPISTPSESHLLPNLLISAAFSPNSPSPGTLPSLAHFCIRALRQARAMVRHSQTTGLKASFSQLTVRVLTDSCAFTFGSRRSKFPPALRSFYIITHFFFAFSRLPHFCLSITFFFPRSTMAPPLPPCLVFQMLLTFHSHLLSAALSHICSATTLLLGSFLLHNPLEMKIVFWLLHDPNKLLSI